MLFCRHVAYRRHPRGGRLIRLMIGDFLGLLGPITGPEAAPLGADYVCRAVDLLSNLLY